MKGFFIKRKEEKSKKKSMRMSFTGTGGVKTLAVRAVHLWGRLMTLLRENPNKMVENKYQATVWRMKGRVRKE